MKTQKHISSQIDFANEGVQEFQKNTSLVGISQLKKQPVDQREFNSFSFNMAQKHIPEIKESLREYANQLIQDYEAKSKEGEETYHLNLHFVGICKK